MKQTRIFSFAALLALLCLPGLSRAQQTLTVYDGTDSSDHVPAYLYYWDDFTKSQFVIPAADLTAMDGGTISALTFYTTSHNVPYTSTSECDVYLKEVTYTTLSAYVAKSTATVVYSGTVSIVATSSGGTMTITFATPYTYNGGNLLIGIENTTDDNYKNIKFYGQTVTCAAGAGSHATSLDDVPFSPYNFIPKTTFTYTAAPEWNFGDTMAYCGTNPTFANGMWGGANSDAVAVKYPASMMGGRNYLRSVFMGIPSSSSAKDYTLRICQAESGGEPVTSSALYTHTYTVPAGGNRWVEWNIPSCALEDDEPLWVIVETDYGINYVETDIHEGNAQLVHRSSGWTDAGSVYSSWSNRMWALYAVTSATQPALPAPEISGPANGQLGQSLTFTATGTSGATFNWTLQGATPSTATGATASATWSAAGTYTVTCTATLGSQTASATHTVTIVDCSGALDLPFTCGFEATDNLACWTFVDADNDGNGWLDNVAMSEAYPDNPNYYTSVHHTGTGCYMSESYYNGPLTPDNWMITPKLHIPSGGATLQWWDYTRHSTDYAEHYSVLVSTSGTATSDFTGNLFETTLTQGNTWTQRSVSLAAYAGQDVYIAFRHYNCTDQLVLAIDDVSVTAGGGQGIDNADAALVKVYPNPATDVVTVRAEALREVSLLDLNGRVLATTASHRVDVSGLASGVYFLRIVTASGIAMEKIVKE